MTCPECHHEHNPDKCQGHVIKDPVTREPIPPRQCEKSPMKGQRVCGTHGGRSPNGIAAGERRQQEQEVDVAIAKLWPALGDVEPVTDPVKMLQLIAGATGQMLQELGRQVNELKSIETGRDLSQLRAVFVAFDRVSARHVASLEAMERLGLTAEAQEMQRMQLTHDQGRLAAAGLLDGFEAIEATAEQRETFTRAFLLRVRSDVAVVAGEVAS